MSNNFTITKVSNFSNRSAPRPVTPESEEEFIQKTVTKAQRSAKAPAEKIIEKIVEVIVCAWVCACVVV